MGLEGYIDCNFFVYNVRAMVLFRGFSDASLEVPGFMAFINYISTFQLPSVHSVDIRQKLSRLRQMIAKKNLGYDSCLQ